MNAYQRTALLVALAMCAACAASQGDKSTTGISASDYEARIAKLEARVEAMENQLKPLGDISERLSTIEQAITLLVGAMERMEEERAAVPAPPPRPMRPDPAVVYSVPVEGSPIVGPKHAKVTIVKAYEYACPFCQRVNPTLDQIKKDYGKDVRIVYKHFIVHPDTATRPAQAACAAHLQNKFEKFNALMWEKAYASGRDFSDKNIYKIAKEAGVRNMKRFKKDMDGQCVQIVRDDQTLLSERGVRGTPAFFINGRTLSGAQPYDNFRRLIDEELAKANAAIKDGAKKNTYYDEYVVKKGKTSL